MKMDFGVSWSREDEIYTYKENQEEASENS